VISPERRYASVEGDDIRPGEICSVQRGKPQATPLESECRATGFLLSPGLVNWRSRPWGMEVEVTESEVPGSTGAWCKRETLRTEAE